MQSDEAIKMLREALHKVAHLPMAGGALASIARNALDATATIEPASAGVPEGWRLVPKEPTDEMCHQFTNLHLDGARFWLRNAIAAAPVPPVATELTVQPEVVLWWRDGAKDVMHNIRFDKPSGGPWVALGRIVSAPVATVQDGYALRALKHIIPFRIELIVGSFGKCASTDVILQACSSAVAEIEAAQSAPGAGAVPADGQQGTLSVERIVRNAIFGNSHPCDDGYLMFISEREVADVCMQVALAIAAMPAAPIAAQEPVAFSEHEKGIIADIEIMSRDSLSGFWPRALAGGALSIIRRLSASYTAPTAPQAGSELPALSDQRIAEIYEQATSYTLKDEDFHGVVAVVRAALAAARQAPQDEDEQDELGTAIYEFLGRTDDEKMAFALAMKGRQYGRDETNDAQLWFHAGWHAKQAPQAVAAPDRDAVLEEAAMVCDAKFMARYDSGHPREASAARACRDEIRALKFTQPSAAPADKRPPSMSMFATMGDYKAARAEFDKGAAPDPCPQCIPGAVCKTPTCGRLLAAAKGGA